MNNICNVILVFAGTWIFCTFANFGLRIARNIYSESMDAVEEPTWANGKSDFHLSLTIGAATAFFVGTTVPTVRQRTSCSISLALMMEILSSKHVFWLVFLHLLDSELRKLCLMSCSQLASAGLTR